MRGGVSALSATFASLSSPSYRRFFPGQVMSLTGTWMQTVAQSWLVLELTGSGTALGAVVALERLPVLLFAPYGGLVADRVDKRRLLIGVQSAMSLLALTLGALTVAGVVQFWHVCLLAVLLGLSNAFENPARQAFVLEMVGLENVRNAVSLNSVIAAAARIVGPAVAGVLIAVVGTGVCFLVNAVTFAAVIYALASMDVRTLSSATPQGRAPRQLTEGLRYVAGNPSLAVPVTMMAVIGMLTYEFQVVLPIMARDVFHGEATVYGVMTAAMGAGALVGGLVIAGRRGRTGLRPMCFHATTFGVAVLAAAAAPGLTVMVIALTLVGAASVAFMAIANSTLQLASTPAMRGRVMALFAMAFLGTTPIGGPIAGWVGENVGGRWAMAMQGGACLAAALYGFIRSRRLRPMPGGGPRPVVSDRPADQRARGQDTLCPDDPSGEHRPPRGIPVARHQTE
jgi:MFS family permease